MRKLTQKLINSLKVKHEKYNIQLLELTCDKNMIDENTFYIEIYRVDITQKTAPQKILTTIEYTFHNDSFDQQQALMKFNDNEVFQVDTNQKANKQINEIVIKHVVAQEDKVHLFHSYKFGIIQQIQEINLNEPVLLDIGKGLKLKLKINSCQSQNEDLSRSQTIPRYNQSEQSTPMNIESSNQDQFLIENFYEKLSLHKKDTILIEPIIEQDIFELKQQLQREIIEKDKLIQIIKDKDEEIISLKNQKGELGKKFYNLTEYIRSHELSQKISQDQTAAFIGDFSSNLMSNFHLDAKDYISKEIKLLQQIDQMKKQISYMTDLLRIEFDKKLIAQKKEDKMQKQIEYMSFLLSKSQQEISQKENIINNLVIDLEVFYEIYLNQKTQNNKEFKITLNQNEEIKLGKDSPIQAQKKQNEKIYSIQNLKK